METAPALLAINAMQLHPSALLILGVVTAIGSMQLRPLGGLAGALRGGDVPRLRSSAPPSPIRPAAMQLRPSAASPVLCVCCCPGHRKHGPH